MECCTRVASSVSVGFCHFSVTRNVLFESFLPLRYGFFCVLIYLPDLCVSLVLLLGCDAQGSFLSCDRRHFLQASFRVNEVRLSPAIILPSPSSIATPPLRLLPFVLRHSSVAHQDPLVLQLFRRLRSWSLGGSFTQPRLPYFPHHPVSSCTTFLVHRGSFASSRHVCDHSGPFSFAVNVTSLGPYLSPKRHFILLHLWQRSRSTLSLPLLASVHP